MARTALVTGANGFFGAHLVRELRDRGWEVIALVRPGSQLSRLEAAIRGDDVLVVSRDLEERDQGPVPGVRAVDAVFHLAAVGLHEAVPRSLDAVSRINVLTTLGAVEVARELGVRRFVYCGSGLEYGAGTDLSEDAPLRPANAYGSSKAAAWLIARGHCAALGISAVSVRPFNLYGQFDSPYSLVGSAIEAALAAGRLLLTEGRQTRDFVYAADAAHAVSLAGELDAAADQVLNVCTGIATTVRSVVELVFATTGSLGTPEFGARETPAGDIEANCGNPSKAAKLLGWRAQTPLQTGIEQTVAWFAAQGAGTVGSVRL